MRAIWMLCCGVCSMPNDQREYEEAAAIAAAELDKARRIDPAVTIYGSHNCVQCAAVRRHLAKESVIYIERKIADYPEIADRARGAGHRTLPIVTIDGHIALSGFNPTALGAEIKKMRSAS